MRIEIRPLRPEDERTSFSSGDIELDRFLRNYAGLNQFRLHLGTTYVAVVESGELPSRPRPQVLVLPLGSIPPRR